MSLLKRKTRKLKPQEKTVALLILPLISGALISCGGSSTSASTNTPDYPNGESTINVYKAVAGPASYQQIDVWFQESGSGNYTNNSSNIKSTQSLSKSCGNVMSNTAGGLTIVAALVSFIPVVGPGLAAATALGGTLAGADGAANASSCQAMEFQQVQQSLASQELQITALQQALQTSDNQIWSTVANNSDVSLTLAYSLYKEGLQTVSNSVQSIMTKSNLWNQNTLQPNPYTSIADYVNQNQGKGFQASTNEFINGSTGQLSIALNRLAGISTLNESNTNGQTLPTVYFDPTSNLVNLYRSIYNVTIDNLTVQLQNPNHPNSVKLINDYNNMVIGLYLQSVKAVQSVYDLSFELNQVNYQLYSKYQSQAQYSSQLANTNSYFGRLLNTAGTYYNPATNGTALSNLSAQTKLYNNAQYQLTIYTASILNTLFQTTLGYLITDHPQGNQSYPDTATFTITNPYNGQTQSGESINYSKLIGARLPDSSLKTPRALIYNAYVSAVANTGSGLNSSLLSAESSNGAAFTYYQFPLMNIAQLSNTLTTYNANSSNTLTMGEFLNTSLDDIPTIYATSSNNNPPVESSVASGTTIQPYSLSNSLGYPTLMGSVTNNLQACNGYPVGSIAGYNLYTYTPNGSSATLGEIGKSYLMCGNWSTAGFPNANSTNGQIGQQILSNTSEVSTYMTSFPSVSNYTLPGTYIINNLEPQYEYYPAASRSTQNSYPSSGSSFSVMNGSNVYWSFNNLGDSITSISGQNMASNYPSLSSGQAVSYILAIQTTLNDGFVASFGLTNSNISGGTGNFSGISINPNLQSVYIDGQPILNQAGAPSKFFNQWGAAPNAMYGLAQNINIGTGYGSNIKPDSSIAPSAVYPTSFILNGNTFIMTGSTTFVPSYIFIGGGSGTINTTLSDNTYAAVNSNGVSCYYPSSLYPANNENAYINLAGGGGYSSTNSNNYIWSLWCETTATN